MAQFCLAAVALQGLEGELGVFWMSAWQLDVDVGVGSWHVATRPFRSLMQDMDGEQQEHCTRSIHFGYTHMS